MAIKEDVGGTVETKLCWALHYLDNVLEDLDTYIAFNRLTIEEQKQVEKSVKSINKLKYKLEAARSAALTADLNIWLG